MRTIHIVLPADSSTILSSSVIKLNAEIEAKQEQQIQKLMKNTSEFIEQFNPKKHPKYSENIYKWLKSVAKRHGLTWDGVVNKMMPNYELGSGFIKCMGLYKGTSSLLPEYEESYRYYIGRVQDDPYECDHTLNHYTSFLGALLSNIRNSGSQAKINSYYNKFNLVDANFWQNYKEKGICAIPDSHQYWADSSYLQRWEQVGEFQRVCKWCGHNQILTKWIETKIIEHERWDSIPV